MIMATSARTKNQVKTLKPNQYLVLVVLAEKDLHAYGIKKEIARRTDDAVNVGPGSLHRIIRQLREMGFLEESDFRLVGGLDDERRKYFRITDAGRNAAGVETDRMAALLDVARASNLGSV
jgi:DNA-binding PadR family transcriptional regulator